MKKVHTITLIRRRGDLWIHMDGEGLMLGNLEDFSYVCDMTDNKGKRLLISWFREYEDEFEADYVNGVQRIQNILDRERESILNRPLEEIRIA